MADGPERVAAAARALGLDISVVTMPASTRTAGEATVACGCTVAQIVKSLVFEVAETGALRLLLVAGDNRVDTEAYAAETGEHLRRADPRRVRAETGFAIGGVPPFGHDAPLPVAMDRALLDQPVVWAAAGGPQVVFSIDPAALAGATKATLVSPAGRVT